MMGEIMREEELEQLKQIAEATERGTFHWECVDHNPIGFLDKDKFFDSSAAVIQTFDFSAEHNGQAYELELTEKIDVPDGKGSIFIRLMRDGHESQMVFEYGLFAGKDLKPYPMGADIEAGLDDPALLLANTLIPAAVDCEAVQAPYEWARFINEAGVSQKLRADPLVQLAEKLCRERRVLDFHRIIFDIRYRRILLNE